jgi:hypothetical protein
VLKTPGGLNYAADDKSRNIVETKPHFYEWATATTGMLAVARKQRSTFRNYVAAETAAPVIACAAGKGPLDELDFQFAGVVRSNSVRTMDDGVGTLQISDNTNASRPTLSQRFPKLTSRSFLIVLRPDDR